MQRSCEKKKTYGLITLNSDCMRASNNRNWILKVYVVIFFSLEVRSFRLSCGSFDLISEILISSGLMGVVGVCTYSRRELNLQLFLAYCRLANPCLGQPSDPCRN